MKPYTVHLDRDQTLALKALIDKQCEDHCHGSCRATACDLFVTGVQLDKILNEGPCE